MDMLLELLQKALKDGLSWGLLITAFLLYRKHRRNRFLNARDRRFEAKLDAIMERVGATCADTYKPTTEPLDATHAGGFLLCWPARFFARCAKWFTILNTRRTKEMKFLAKLGSRKFWALVASLVTSSMVLFGYTDDVIVKVSAIVANVGAVVVYLLVEGGIDKEAQKQNVYVVNKGDEPSEKPFTGDGPAV